MYYSHSGNVLLSRTMTYPKIVVSHLLRKVKQVVPRKTIYSRTSLIRTPKGQNEVFVLERCTYKRGHYDHVTFMTPLEV